MCLVLDKYMLETTEGAIKNGQSRETGNIDEDYQNKKHNTIYVGYHYTQTDTNNVSKTRTLLQTITGKDEPNIVVMRKLLQISQHGTFRHTIGQKLTKCMPSFLWTSPFLLLRCA